MAKPFVPGTPLEEQAYAGKYQAVVDLLRTLDASGRQALGGVAARLVKISQAARYAYDGTFAGWGRSPSDEQLRAVGAAAVVCGSAKVAAEAAVGFGNPDARTAAVIDELRRHDRR